MTAPSADVPAALRGLGLRAPGDALAALFAHATKSRLSPIETIEHLIALEHREREVRNLAQRTRLATLGKFKPLDQFDWNWPRRIERALYEQLLGCEFIGTSANVLLRGPSGTGKTSLAQNLGFIALQQGHRVRFTTLAQALADLSKHDSLPAFERRLRTYTKPALLILDELGCAPRSATTPCGLRGPPVIVAAVTRS